MKKIQHILLILALVIGASLSLPSCGGDDNGSDAIILDGLWEITEISEEEDPVAEGNEAGDDTTAGDGNAGAGSPPAKTGGDSQEEIVEDFGYIRFDLNTYAYFKVEGQTITTHRAGTYILSGKTLTLTEDENSALPVVAMVELKGTNLTMEMEFEEGPQTWHAQKMAEDPFLDNGDGTAYVDFESQVHRSDSVQGSLWNPEVIAFHTTITDTLVYVEAYKAEQFYYIKVDSAKTYQLKVELDDPKYDLPAGFMEYVQVWLSYQPYAKNYQAEGNRIELNTDDIETNPSNPSATFSDIKSPTGYLYIRLFSYQDEIKYELTLSEQ